MKPESFIIKEIFAFNPESMDSFKSLVNLKPNSANQPTDSVLFFTCQFADPTKAPWLKKYDNLVGQLQCGISFPHARFIYLTSY